ncbi:MAG TPA: hypothetical protein VF124_05440 [Gaiellaceae bacterium]
MRQELSFAYDYGQLYLYDAAAAESVDFLAALDDSVRTGLSVGVADGLVDLLLPLQWNFSAPLLLETCEGEPRLDLEEWEHTVEFALQLPSGRLLLEASGGSGRLEIEVPPATYRARWSGRDFPPPGDYVPGESSEDQYRLQLWIDGSGEAPRELKRWPGYDVWSG